MPSRRPPCPDLARCVLALASVGGRVPNPPWLVMGDGFCRLQRSAHGRDHHSDEQAEREDDQRMRGFRRANTSPLTVKNVLDSAFEIRGMRHFFLRM